MLMFASAEKLKLMLVTTELAILTPKSNGLKKRKIPIKTFNTTELLNRKKKVSISFLWNGKITLGTILVGTIKLITDSNPITPFSQHLKTKISIILCYIWKEKKSEVLPPKLVNLSLNVKVLDGNKDKTTLLLKCCKMLDLKPKSKLWLNNTQNKLKQDNIKILILRIEILWLKRLRLELVKKLMKRIQEIWNTLSMVST